MSDHVNAPYAAEAGIYSPTGWNTVCSLDPWVCSSLLQKSIRRADTPLAVAAALRLFQLRGAAIWSRLLVIAVEDIGIGSLSALELATETAKLARRQPKGDMFGTLARLTETLAHAPKDRSSDYLVCAARDHPDYERDRCLVGQQSIEQRIEMATDKALPVVTRAIAAWFASGLNWEGESRVGKGDLPALLQRFVSAGVPETLLHATEYACSRVPHPMCIMLPVIWMEAFAANTGSSPSVFDRACEFSPAINGVPAYAYDKHTRSGKIAIGRFACVNEQVAKVLNQRVPDFRGRDAAAMAAFYVDAIPVRPQLSWHGTHELEALGRQADFHKIGFPIAGINELIEAVTQNLDHLNQLRAKQALGKSTTGGSYAE